MKLWPILLICALLLPACTQHDSAAYKDRTDVELVASSYHENAIYNYHLGRTYMAESRYELARERFLLALACSRNEDMRLRAAEELEAAERQIASQR